MCAPTSLRHLIRMSRASGHVRTSHDAASGAALDEGFRLAALVSSEAFASFPADGLQAAVSERGGEVSASVEETNRCAQRKSKRRWKLTRRPTPRIRAALGMKPLSVGAAAPRVAAADPVDVAEMAAAAAAQLAERTAAARDRRLAAASLAATPGLGDSGVDDAGAWAARSRALAATAAVRSSAPPDARAAAPPGADAGGEGGVYGSACLAGVRVAPAALAALVEGDALVLTLADGSVLDGDGARAGEGAVLESVRARELARRDDARAAATKPTRWGAPPGEAAAVGGGVVAAPLVLSGREVAAPHDATAHSDRHAGVRARLAAAAAAAAAGAATGEEGGATGLDAGAALTVDSRPLPPSEFLTRDEARDAAGGGGGGGGAKALRRKKRFARRPAPADEPLLLPPLPDAPREHVKPDAGVAGAGADEGWASFAAAKAKAAARSAAVLGTAPLGGGGGEEEEEEAVAGALRRSAGAAAAAAAHAAPAQATAPGARLLQAAAAGAAAATGGGWAPSLGSSPPRSSLLLTDTAEFVRTVRPEPRAPPPPSADAGAGAGGAGGGARAGRVYRAHRSPSPDDAAPAAPDAPAPPPPPPPPPDATVAAAAWPAPGGVGGGGARGRSARGVGATLSLLKTTGTLAEGVTWAGRANDKKPSAVAGAVAAAAVGTPQLGTAAGGDFDFGFKLDRFDEFGRKMTPKEAFRELCHKFHGIFPSRSKQEARLKQWHEEQAALKSGASAAAPGGGEAEGAALSATERMRRAHKDTATPFLVLSGRVTSSQVADASSRFATQERAEESAAPAGAAAPGARFEAKPLALPLHATGAPLLGAEKVRFMLGMGAAEGGKKRKAGDA